MIVGSILVGCMIGVVAALGALVLGQGVLTALLIYSGTGCACVLALALRVVLRPDLTPDTDTETPARWQRGEDNATPRDPSETPPGSPNRDKDFPSWRDNPA